MSGVPFRKAIRFSDLNGANRGEQVFKDDRLISVLTAVVLMLVIGTFAQRFDPAPPVSVPGLAFGADAAMVRAGGLVRIDVLANDAGVPVRAASGLVVTQPPPCGRLFVQGTALQYLADPGCIGPQVFGYGLQGVLGEGSGRIVVLAAAQPDDPGALTLSNIAVALPPDPAAAGIEATGPVAPVVAEVDPALARKAAAVLAPATAPTATVTNTAPAPQPAQRRTEDAKAVARPPVAQPVRSVAEAAQTANRATPLRRPADNAAGIVLVQPKPAAKPQEAAPVPQGAKADAPGPSALANQTAPRRAEPAAPPAAASATAVVAARPGREAAAVAPEPSPAAAADAAGGALPAREVAATPARADAAPTGDEEAVPVRAAAVAPVQTDAVPAVPAPAALPARAAAVRPGPSGAPQTPAAVPLAAPADAVPVIARAEPVAAPLSPLRQGAANPVAKALESPAGPAPAPRVAAPDPAPERTAALTPAAQPCNSPVRVQLDPGPAAVTGVSVDAPCAAHSVAELAYAGLRLALVLDGAGRGRIDVPVLAPNAPARLSLVGGAVQDLTLTARDLGRVERVAVGWTDPVPLSLRAREFGGPGEVSASNPGDAERARRQGGGFLTRFAPIGGQGQSVQIYSYVRPNTLASGVIDLALGYDLPPGGQPPCLRDAAAAPRYTVLRLGHDRAQRPLLGQMPGTDCAAAGASANPGAANAAHALTNLIITPR